VSRAAGSSDDDFQAALDGRTDVFLQPARIAVGGYDSGLGGDAKFGQCVGGLFHCGPVGVAAHENADQWGGARLITHKKCGIEIAERRRFCKCGLQKSLTNDGRKAMRVHASSKSMH